MPQLKRRMNLFIISCGSIYFPMISLAVEAFFFLRRQAILVAFFYLSVLPTISNQGSLTSVGKFQTELGKAWALEIASRRRKEG